MKKPNRVIIRSSTIVNFTNVEDCEIKPPESGAFMITGENGCGKTHTITAMLLPLSTGKKIANPVRHGEHECRIVTKVSFVFDDREEDFTIEERFCKKRSITVTSNGKKVGGSTWVKDYIQLPTLINFPKMTPRTQAREIIKLFDKEDDFKGLNKEIERAKEGISAANTWVNFYKKKGQELAIEGDFEREPLVSHFMQKLENGRIFNENVMELRAKKQSFEKIKKPDNSFPHKEHYVKLLEFQQKVVGTIIEMGLQNKLDDVSDFVESKITNAKSKHELEKSRYQQALKIWNDAQQVLKDIEGSVLIDLSALEAELQKEQSFSKDRNQFNEWQKAKAELAIWQRELSIEKKSKLVAENHKKTLIKGFDLPVIGDYQLIFDEDKGLMMHKNGVSVPFDSDHTSLSEMIALGLALNIKNKPNCAIYYVEGSALGVEKIKEIDQIARDNKALVIIERATLRKSDLFIGDVNSFLNK